jgi:hypothetical protein
MRENGASGLLKNEMIRAAGKMRGGELIRSLDPADRKSFRRPTGRGSGASGERVKSLDQQWFQRIGPEEKCTPGCQARAPLRAGFDGRGRETNGFPARR